MGKSSNHLHYLSSNLQMALGPLGRLHSEKVVKLLSRTNSYPTCNSKAWMLMAPQDDRSQQKHRGLIV
jgi:hypothetical protein